VKRVFDVLLTCCVFALAAASATSPYGNVVDVEGGGRLLFSTMERPKFIFNADGVATHLSNGVCPGNV
jgi:hypothetical protein